MIDALIKRVSVTYTCYEMYAHREEKFTILADNAPLSLMRLLHMYKNLLTKAKIFIESVV
jgi:hypothetical protein